MQRSISITLDEKQFSLLSGHAQKAEIGGVSRVRTDDRKEKLSEDQLHAQEGECALSIAYTGDTDLYERTRLEREKNPYVGDNGSDLLGLNVDIKTSVMRRGRDFLYHLWIRPEEYHKETIYYLGLIDPEEPNVVIIDGWARGKNIGFNKEKGKYEMRRDKLNSMFTSDIPKEFLDKYRESVPENQLCNDFESIWEN
jgi:hypothetical protein